MTRRRSAWAPPIWVPPPTAETVRGCTDKVRYSSSSDAGVAIKRIKKVSGKRLHRYHCTRCDGFHLTSVPVSVTLAWDAYHQEKGSA